MKETYRVPCLPEISKFLKLDASPVRDELFEALGFSEREAERPIRSILEVTRSAGMEDLTGLQTSVYGRQDAA